MACNRRQVTQFIQKRSRGSWGALCPGLTVARLQNCPLGFASVGKAQLTVPLRAPAHHLHQLRMCAHILRYEVLRTARCARGEGGHLRRASSRELSGSTPTAHSNWARSCRVFRHGAPPMHALGAAACPRLSTAMRRGAQLCFCEAGKAGPNPVSITTTNGQVGFAAYISTQQGEAVECDTGRLDTKSWKPRTVWPAHVTCALQARCLLKTTAATVTCISELLASCRRASGSLSWPQATK